MAVALDIPASLNWIGIDGNWSAFDVRIGTPAQTTHLLPSLAAYQTLAIIPEGCYNSASYSTCDLYRGGLFDRNASSTAVDIGIYDINVAEVLNVESNAQFSFETVSLMGDVVENLTAQHSVVGGMADTDFFVGLLGLNPKPTNFSSFNDESPSYLDLLKRDNLITSLSAAFSAGASYRSQPAALSLGGYDAAKIIENDVRFVLSADNSREVVVSINAIDVMTQYSSENNTLTNEPIYAHVDSTIPDIWLPASTCGKFEREFGLEYDETTDLYLVNDTQHDALVNRNVSIVFELAKHHDSQNSLQITLPYAAFDLIARQPYRGIVGQARYFPIRRAHNDTQITLGRTFLQEAYVSVDWEDRTFNISQRDWSGSGRQMVTIQHNSTQSEERPVNGAQPDTEDKRGSHRGLSVGAIAGIVIAIVTAFVVLTAYLTYKLISLRRGQEMSCTKYSDDTTSLSSASIGETREYRKPELQGIVTVSKPAMAHFHQTPSISPLGSIGLAGNGPCELSPVAISPISVSPISTSPNGSNSPDQTAQEMYGDATFAVEKDGAQLGEKQAMRFREQQYNNRNVKVKPIDEDGVAPCPPYTTQDLEDQGEKWESRYDGQADTHFSFSSCKSYLDLA